MTKGEGYAWGYNVAEEARRRYIRYILRLFGYKKGKDGEKNEQD